MLNVVGSKEYKSYLRGCNCSLAVYTIKKNTLDLIGVCNFSTASNKGDEGEIMELLLEKKLITEKLYNSSHGRYIHSMKTDKKLSIQII